MAVGRASVTGDCRVVRPGAAPRAHHAQAKGLASRTRPSMYWGVEW